MTVSVVHAKSKTLTFGAMLHYEFYICIDAVWVEVPANALIPPSAFYSGSRTFIRRDDDAVYGFVGGKNPNNVRTFT